MRCETTIRVEGIPAPISIESGYMVIRESMDFTTASATIAFKDRVSAFVSGHQFMQDTKVDIAVDDGSKVAKWGMYAFSSVKDRNAGVESFNFTLDLISRQISKLYDREYHSKKCTASDYVKYIAGKAGLKHDVESTNEVRSWVNPNWTLIGMLRHLAVRAVSASGSSGYMYFVRRDGTLVFQSIDSLFGQTAIDITAGNYAQESDDLDEQTDSNKKLTIRDNHFANVLLGANNVGLTYYDFKLGAMVHKEVDYSKFVKKRGAVKGVSVELASKGTEVYVGDWDSSLHTEPANIGKHIYNKVLRQSESVQVNIITPFDNRLDVGGVINLSIPANESLITGGVNLNYSGRYLIKTINTVGNGDFIQNIVLIRPGMSLSLERKPGYF